MQKHATKQKSNLALSSKILNLKHKILGFIRDKKGRKRRLNDSTYGTLYIKSVKHNLYLNLSDSQNRLKATISTGYIKAKGRARRQVYILKKFAKRFFDLILASKIKKIHLVLSGHIPLHIKRIFLSAFSFGKRRKKKKNPPKFQFYRYTKYLRTPHNGCRPRKIRRK